MPNGYDEGVEAQKQYQQVPKISVFEYEQEVKRIMSRDGATIERQKKEIADFDIVIQSKRHRIASLDTELEQEIAEKRATAEVLVDEAEAKLKAATLKDEEAEAYAEAAAKTAVEADGALVAVQEVRKSLEKELEEVKAKNKALDVLGLKLTEDTKKLENQVYEAGMRQDEIDVRIRTLNRKTSELNDREEALNLREAGIDLEKAGLEELRKNVDDGTTILNDLKETVRITKEERTEFEAAVAANDARRDGFAETERRLEARENKIRLDEKALKDGSADLERRKKNVESLEAAAAKKLDQ